MAARFSRNVAGQLMHRWRSTIATVSEDDARRRHARFADVATARNPALHGGHAEAAVGRLQRTLGNQAVQALLVQRWRDDKGRFWDYESMAAPPAAWKFESVTDKGATHFKPTASTPSVVRDAFAAGKPTTSKFVADVKSGAVKVDATPTPATIPAAAGPAPAAAKPAKDYTTIFKMDPAKIRFSQDSISGQFKGDEGNVNTLAANLKSGAVSADRIPAIMLVERQGRIITLDNRRLYAFKQAGVEVRCRWATPDEVKNNSFKFTAGRLGKATIEVRL